MIMKKKMIYFLFVSLLVFHMKAGQEAQPSLNQMCIDAFIIKMNASEHEIIRSLDTIIKSTNSGESIANFLLGKVSDINICSEYKNFVIYLKATYTVEKLAFLLGQVSEFS